MDLAETFSRVDLDPLFDAWLSSGKPPIDAGPPGQQSVRLSVRDLPAAARNLAERLHDRHGQPFRDATGKAP